MASNKKGWSNFKYSLKKRKDALFYNKFFFLLHLCSWYIIYIWLQEKIKVK